MSPDTLFVWSALFVFFILFVLCLFCVCFVFVWCLFCVCLVARQARADFGAGGR